MIHPKEILNLKMQPNDAEAKTIGQYLIKLLYTVWAEGEGFSGKRPFGNSDWGYELYVPLIKAGVIEGEFDQDGYIDYVNEKQGYLVIVECIKELYPIS